MNTGGNNFAHITDLPDGRILVTTHDCKCIYKSIDDFLSSLDGEDVPIEFT
jgi:hypothetical protein